MAYRTSLKAAAAAAVLGFSAAVASGAMAAAAPGLAAAAPIESLAQDEARGVVHLAQRRGRAGRRGVRRGRGYRRGARRGYRRGLRRGYRRGLRRGYRRGYRRRYARPYLRRRYGYGYRRPWRRGWYGYRRPGYWIGPAIGAIIGGSIAASKNRYGSAWERCDDRYRSFRWSDGTFQPYGGGPRKLCPYLRR